MGDINPQNILVQNENNVYFVDCDSYQVEGFPCPVGAVNFVAPEIQGKDFSTFLRTEEHELFAIATLLFMILLPGKQPYSHQGGTNGADNIRKMHFPYPLGEKKSELAPDGVWRLCWSHLSYPIKEAFYNTFHSDFRNVKRTAILEWISLLEDYERLLADPAKVFTGPAPQYGFDLSILPENYRYVPGKNKEVPSGETSDLKRIIGKLANRERSLPGQDSSRKNGTGTFQTNRRPIRSAGGSSQSPSARRIKRVPTSASQPIYGAKGKIGKSGSPKPAPSSNPAPTGNQSQSPCFVATAVYQDQNHPVVHKLRCYRDQRLKLKSHGNFFIRTYNAVGPHGAMIVQRFPITRSLIKPILSWIASRL